MYHLKKIVPKSSQIVHCYKSILFIISKYIHYWYKHNFISTRLLLTYNMYILFSINNKFYMYPELFY